MRKEEATEIISGFITDILNQESLTVPEKLDGNSILFGANGLLDSMLLVELMFKLEDYCDSSGIQFAWTSDSTMSAKNSHYNTIGSLADFLVSLAENK